MGRIIGYFNIDLFEVKVCLTYVFVGSMGIIFSNRVGHVVVLVVPVIRELYSVVPKYSISYLLFHTHLVKPDKLIPDNSGKKIEVKTLGSRQVYYSSSKLLWISCLL